MEFFIWIEWNKMYDNLLPQVLGRLCDCHFCPWAIQSNWRNLVAWSKDRPFLTNAIYTSQADTSYWKDVSIPILWLRTLIALLKEVTEYCWQNLISNHMYKLCTNFAVMQRSLFRVSLFLPCTCSPVLSHRMACLISVRCILVPCVV